MSDSSPEDFMQQALALITELKKALEASFDAQDTRINESFDAQNTRINRLFATQDTRIDNIANDFTSLNNDFQKHTQNSHASKSYVTNAITTHAQSHKQELQDAGFISVATYQAKIQEFEGRIAKLEEQIKQPTTLSEEGKGAPKVIALSIPESRDGHSGINKQPQEKPGEKAPSDNSGENNTTTENSTSSDTGNPAADGVLPTQVAQTNQITPSTSTTPPIDFGVNDPDVSKLETAILKEIRNSKAYTSINNINRGRLLNQANTIKSENKSVSDNALHMQVILALYFLQNKPSTVSLNETTDLYKDCYNGESPKITKLQAIVDTFLGIEKLTVTVATFQEAINNDNFKTIMINGAIGDGNYKKSVINKIKPENKGAKQ